jgi:ABC-type glycerol-3-phosphate transport system substrate-binding protein
MLRAIRIGPPTGRARAGLLAGALAALLALAGCGGKEAPSPGSTKAGESTSTSTSSTGAHRYKQGKSGY